MSWIIIDKETKKVVVELFDYRNILKLNTDKYVALSAHDYLCGLNTEINK